MINLSGKHLIGPEHLPHCSSWLGGWNLVFQGGDGEAGRGGPHLTGNLEQMHAKESDVDSVCCYVITLVLIDFSA